MIEHIYIINLPHRTDRRDAMNEQLVKYDLLRYSTYVGGVYNSEFPHRGLTFTLINLFQRILEQTNYDTVLILEDDAQFLYDPNDTLMGFIGFGRPKDFKLCYLGANLYKKPKPYSSNLWEMTGAMALHAVVYTRKVMMELVAKYQWEKPEEPFDVILDRDYIQKGGCYCVSPLLAVQRDSLSDIEGKEVNYTKYAYSTIREKGIKVMEFHEIKDNPNPYECWYKNYIP